MRLGRDSGGLDSYTNVSSESEVSASSTALATLASKMSALDVTVPAWSDGGLRANFFLSFFGLIVSELGFVLTLPFPSLPDMPRSPPITCGTDSTVSVSTVIVRGGSIVDLVLVPDRFVNDLLAKFVVAGRGVVEGFESALILPSDSAFISFPAVVLSLLRSSLAVEASAGAEAEAEALIFVIWRLASAIGSDIGPIDGVLGALFSATVSRMEFDVLAPLGGLLSPVEGDLISSSVSCVFINGPGSGADTGANRFSDVLGWVCSASSFLAILAALLVPLLDGGGDLNRGDIGQEGELLPDFATLSTWAASAIPSPLVGKIEGFWAAIARWTAAAEGMPAKDPVILATRVGLRSVLSFLNLLLGAPAVAVSVARMGEPSRDDLVGLVDSCGFICIDVGSLSGFFDDVASLDSTSDLD